MSYHRRVVKRRPAGLTDEEWLSLLATRFVSRGYFQPRDGRDVARVAFDTVLCWWCRSRHSPSEVKSCMALPRKTALAETSESSTSSAMAAGLLSEYSELWAFLTAVTYPDGSKRLTGKISLSCESGQLGLLLTDPETQAYAFLNGKSLTDLLTDAELRLSDGSLSWRASKYPSRGKGR
jgi:hypothetical protein